MEEEVLDFSKTTENHFNERIVRTNNKGEITCYSDVNEEIDVYKDYINYENFCPGCWENYYKFNYKIEQDRLLIKCFEFEHISYRFKKEYYTVSYKFIKDGKFDENEMKRYFIDEQRWDNTWYDAHRRFEYKYEVKDSLKWFEFKQNRIKCRYTNRAKARIMKQIRNKNFKDK